MITTEEAKPSVELDSASPDELSRIARALSNAGLLDFEVTWTAKGTPNRVSLGKLVSLLIDTNCMREGSPICPLHVTGRTLRREGPQSIALFMHKDIFEHWIAHGERPLRTKTRPGRKRRESQMNPMGMELLFEPDNELELDWLQ